MKVELEPRMGLYIHVLRHVWFCLWDTMQYIKLACFEHVHKFVRGRLLFNTIQPLLLHLTCHTSKTISGRHHPYCGAKSIDLQHRAISLGECDKFNWSNAVQHQYHTVWFIPFLITDLKGKWCFKSHPLVIHCGFLHNVLSCCFYRSSLG